MKLQTEQRLKLSIARLPERSAVALAEIIDILAGAVTGEQGEREIARLLFLFFGSLVARPGRPRLKKYRRAAELYRDGQKSFHQLCVKLETQYPTATKARRRKMRDAMRSGVLRAMQNIPTKSTM